MKSLIKIWSCAALAASQACLAVTVPTPSRDDPRVVNVRYNKDEVVLVRTQRGTVTRIVLADDEKIADNGVATGFASDCSKPELEWCIVAVAGANHLLIKPKEGATRNNIELLTDTRSYSFTIMVVPDSAAGQTTGAVNTAVLPMHRLTFLYPARSISEDASAAINRVAPRLDAASGPVETANPEPRNWSYSVHAPAGSGGIVPDLVFDDAHFTYFSFRADQEIPTIFAISQAGEESRVNFHMEGAGRNLVAVQRTAPRFVLRLGEAAVGIWNDGFGRTALREPATTTFHGSTRVLRGGK